MLKRDSFALLVVLICLTAATLPALHSYPPVMFDEASLTRIAEFFQNERLIRSDYILSQERGAFWLPPVYYFLLASVYSIFGEGIFISRLLSLILGMCTLLLTHLILRRQQVSSMGSLCILLFIASDPAFLRAATLARPEMSALFFLMLTFWILSSAPPTGNLPRIWAAGLLFSTAICTHPLAAILLPVPLLLIHQKEKRRIFYPAFFTPLLIFLLLIIVWIIPHWNDAWPQILRNLLFRKSDSWWSPLLRFIEDYLHHPLHLFAYSAAVCISLFRLFKDRLKLRWYFMGGLLVVPFLRIFSGPESIVYVTPFIPPILATVILSGDGWKRIRRRVSISLALAAAALSLFFHLKVTILFVDDDTPERNYRLFTEVIAARLPKNAHVMAYGYPDVAPLLWRERPDLRITTFYWFGDTQAVRHLRSLDYILFTNTVLPTGDWRKLMIFGNQTLQRMNAAGREIQDTLLIGDPGKIWTFHAGIYRLGNP